MTSRSRDGEWDPMQEDFDNTNYNQQYGDDDSGTLVKLDHKRLHITNIPTGLSTDGLRTAFEKYGSLTEVFISNNPNKRFGLVTYETAAEARLAMTKLNQTEPLRLNINIAHEQGTKKKMKEAREKQTSVNNGSEQETTKTYKGRSDRNANSYQFREKGRSKNEDLERESTRNNRYQEREREGENNRHQDRERERENKYQEREREKDDRTSIGSRDRNTRYEDDSKVMDAVKKKQAEIYSVDIKGSMLAKLKLPEHS